MRGSRPRDDHRVEHGGTDDAPGEQRRAVHHHVHALLPEPGEPAVADRGGDDRLAGELLPAEPVELVHRRHDDGGVAQRPGQQEVRPAIAEATGQHGLGQVLRHVVRPGRVQLEALERVDQRGCAELQQGVCELQVRRVLGHGARELVVVATGEEQDPGVGEVSAEPLLDVAQRPLLEDLAQACTGGGRRAVRARVGGFCGDVVGGEAEPDRVRLRPPVLQQPGRAGLAAAGPDPAHGEAFAQEPGPELEVLGPAAEADADDALHGITCSTHSRSGARRHRRIYGDAVLACGEPRYRGPCL